MTSTTAMTAAAAATDVAAAAAPETMQTTEAVFAAMDAVMTGAEGRPLTDEEVGRYEALEARLQTVQRDVQTRRRHGAYASVQPASPGLRPSAGPRADDTLDRAFDAYLRTGRAPADLSDRWVSNPTQFSPGGARMAQSEGTPSEGGYLVPDGFRARMIEVMKAFGGIANVAEVITTTSGNPLPWPTVDDTDHEAEIVEEGGTFSSGADLTFTDASLGAYSYASSGASATPIRLSWELTQDTVFDLVGLVSRLLGRRISRTQASHLATGTGAGQPLGLISGLAGVQSAANTGLTYNDLLTKLHSVDPAYRGPTCRWVFNDGTLKVIEQLVDSNGDPLWRSLQSTIGDAASNGRLLGYPVTIDQGMPDYAADSATVNWGAFGDIRAGYVIRNVRGIAVVVNPWTRANYRQTEYTAWARMDATQQDTNAYVALTSKA